jgi:putative hydrolase of the HAD superfamily
MNKNCIKNIIFDLGAVLFNIDHALTIKSFEDLGIQDLDSLYSENNHHVIFDQYEKGEVSTSRFIEKIREYMPLSVSEKDVAKAWNTMLLDFPQTSFDLLNRLKPNYQLFLLSNTNALHFSGFHDILLKQHGMHGLECFFEKAYYSHLIGMRKPDKEIFEFVLKENKLDPDKTLFIDDFPQHVEGAEEAGINGVLLTKDSSVSNLFGNDNKFIFH